MSEGPELGERLERQVAALVARVGEAAAAERRALEDAADGEVAALRAATRRDAHARVRAAAADKRRRVAERCRLALAAAETRQRAAGFAHERDRLERAYAALRVALGAAWREPVARERWWRDALALAARRLVARDWLVEVGEGSDVEAATIAAAATALGAHARVVVLPGLAGVRISTPDGARVDAAVDGLLHDRARLEARLLAALAREDTP